MKTTTTQVLKALSLSVALLGSAAVVMTVSLTDAAYANNGKGNGNGNGNGGGGNSNGGGENNGGGGGKSNAGGNGGGSDKSAGKSGGNEKRVDFSKGGKAAEKSKAAERKAAKRKVAKAEAPEPTEVGEVKAGKIKSKHVDGDGYAHPSELGALNAARANPRALENASANSRVGRIAAYRDLVLEGRELEAERDEKSKLLASLKESLGDPRELDAIDKDLAVAALEIEAKKEAIRLLEDERAEAVETAPDTVGQIDEELVAAREALKAAEYAAQDLQDERSATEEYQTLTKEIADLTTQIEQLPDETETLEAAANKEVTDDVEATVRKLLGLDE